jgi:hypothetical protein
VFVKFMRSVDVDKILAGSILFRPLRYYRILEIVSGDRWIGDRSEGVSHWIENNPLASEPSDSGKISVNIDVASGAIEMSGPPKGVSGIVMTSGVADNIHSMGMSEGSSANLRAHVVDGFAFCFSKGDLDSLWPVMCRQTDDDPYDAAVEINDLYRFVINLYFFGTLHIKHEPVIRVCDFFTLNWGPIQYRSGTNRHDGAPVSKKVPLTGRGIQFIKSIEYQKQSEWRILLYPRKVLYHSFLPVVVPHIGQLVQVRRRSPFDGNPPLSVAERDMRDCKMVLDELSEEGLGHRIAESLEVREEVFRKVAKVYLAAYKNGFHDVYIDMLMDTEINSQGPLGVPVPGAQFIVRTCIEFLERQTHTNH